MAINNSDSILNRIKPIHESPPYLKVLLYGEPGVGKTIWAAGAPKPIFLDSEYGTRSLLNHPEFARIPVLPVAAFNDVDDFFWEAKAGNIDAETYVIDSFSELQRRSMDEIMDKNAMQDKSRSLYLPFMQDYKINTEVMRRLITSFRDLDANLIITAHALVDKDEGTGALMVRPMVTPKLAQTLHGIFDLVGYMTLEEGDSKTKDVRYLQVMPTRRVVAKTRIGGLPPIIKDPTFKILLDAMEAQNKLALPVIE